ncbi:MAG: hypothetical protein ACYS0E_14105 [Planctomycetota bacterium]
MSDKRTAFAVLCMLVLGAGGLLPADAAPNRPKNPVEVPFTVLAEGQFSCIDYPLEQAVRDQEAWESLWFLHSTSTCGFSTPPPAVNFDEQIVVAALLGMRANTRFSVHIDTVTLASDGGYDVTYVEEEVRKKNRVFDDIMTTPFVFAVLPRTDGSVTFTYTKVFVKRSR